MKRATKDSWKTFGIINSCRIETSIYFSQEQFNKITFGNIPESMDDRWFVYFHDGTLNIFRSWTGYQIYQSQIHQISEDKYEIRDFLVEGDSQRYSRRDDSGEINSFNEILQYILLDRVYRNHIRDGILGLIVGDALGVPVEFKNRDYLRLNPIVDMVGYGTYNLPEGTWSDDSSLSLCLAEELIAGFDINRIGKSFVKWLYENHWTPHGKVFDIGNATRIAIEKIRSGINPLLSGNKEEFSNGNGSLMRILPLLFHIRFIENSLDRYNIVKDVSSLTHAHIRSVLACFYYLEFARAICDIEFKHYGYEQANISFTNLTKELEIEEKEVSYFSRLLAGKIDELPMNKIESSGYVIDTLEASIWCILTTESYKEAVLKAVNLGEDTDTIASITGGLAGIIYGAENIPDIWLDKIARIEDIEKLITELTNRYRQASY